MSMCEIPVKCSTWGVIKNGTWNNGAILANDKTNWITTEDPGSGGNVWSNAVQTGGSPPAGAHDISESDWPLIRGGDCYDGYIQKGDKCFCLVENGTEVQVEEISCPE